MKRNNGGRPSKFTPALQRRVIKAISIGTPLVHAVRTAGVVYQTFLNRRAKDDRFDAAVEQALSKAVQCHLAVIDKARKSKDESVSLRASCWWLTHVAGVREHFSESHQHQHLHVSGPQQVIVYLPAKVDPAEIKDALPQITDEKRED